MKTPFVIFILLYSWCKLLAQSPIFQQEYLIPGCYLQQVNHCASSDGGFFFTAKGNLMPQTFDLAVKTDSSGNPEWYKRFDGSGNLSSDPIQLTDGSFLMCHINQNDQGAYRIINLDPFGNTVYSKRLVMSGFIAVAYPTLIVRPDGNIYICSSIRTPSGGQHNWALTEISPAGDVIWSKYYSDHININVTMSICNNGDLIVSGAKWDAVTSDLSPFITRVDSSGQELWSKWYITYQQSVGYAISEVENGAIDIVGAWFDPIAQHFNSYCVQTDANGNIQKTSQYRHATQLMQALDCTGNAGKDLYVSGNSDTGNFCMKIDYNLNVIASSEYPSVHAFSLQAIPNLGLSMSGFTNAQQPTLFTADSATQTCFSLQFPVTRDTISFFPQAISGVYNLIVNSSPYVLSDTILNIQDTMLCIADVGIHELTNGALINVFPNPATDVVNISSSSQITQIDLMDITGRTVSVLMTNQNSCQLDISAVSCGCYILRIYHDSGIESHRLVIE